MVAIGPDYFVPQASKLLFCVLRPCHTSRLTAPSHNGKVNHRLGLPVKNQLNNLPIAQDYQTELFYSFYTTVSISVDYNKYS